MLRTLKLMLLAAGGVAIVGTGHAEDSFQELVEQTGVQQGKVALRDHPGWRAPEKIVIRQGVLSPEAYRELVPGVDVVEVANEADAIANAAGADAVIGWCSDRLLEAARDAYWVQIFSAGAEKCVVTEQVANGSVMLTNMQKMSSPVLAEHTIALALSLARRLPLYAKSMADGAWRNGNDVTGGMQSVGGKTMLVLGLGGIGTEVARRAAAMDMRVIGTRRSSREGPEFVDYVGLSDELYKLAAESDFIVNTLPLTPETTGLLDERFFNAAQRGAFLINVGRGGTIVTEDLVAALMSGQIAGAALDVTDPEPLPADHPLWQMEHVLITPHVAGRGGNRTRHMILLTENLRRFAAGDALFNVVDPELGY